MSSPGLHSKICQPHKAHTRYSLPPRTCLLRNPHTSLRPYRSCISRERTPRTSYCPQTRTFSRTRTVHTAALVRPSHTCRRRSSSTMLHPDQKTCRADTVCTARFRLCLCTCHLRTPYNRGYCCCLRHTIDYHNNYSTYHTHRPANKTRFGSRFQGHSLRNTRHSRHIPRPSNQGRDLHTPDVNWSMRPEDRPQNTLRLARRTKYTEEARQKPSAFGRVCIHIYNKINNNYLRCRVYFDPVFFVSPFQALK